MSGAATYLFVLVLGFGLSVLARAWPRMRNRNFGVDAFYALALVRAIRRQKRLPVFMDTYMLDSGEQRYPPGFPLFLALLPRGLTGQKSWLINPVLDAGLGAALGGLLWAHGASAAQVLWALLAWALTPALVDECFRLNGRIFGNILFSVTMLLLANVLLGGGAWAAAALVLAGFAMLMSHKMSTQNLVFVVLGLSVWRQGWAPLGLLGLVLAASVALSAGFCFKVFAGNIDILLFWRRNLKLLYAHAVYRSPLYDRDPEVRALAAGDASFFKPGVGGQFSILLRIFEQNFLLPLFAVVVWTDYSWWSDFEQLLAAWVILTYAWAALTTFAPPLRFLGEGIKYAKMAALPMAYLVAAGIGWGASPWLLPAFLACLALNAWKVRRIYDSLTGTVDDARGLRPVIDYLRAAADDGVLTLPAVMSERIAHETGKKVFWGGHGGGFKKLEEYYPVLRRRVEEYFMRYNLTYLLLDLEYVDPRFLALDPFFDPVVPAGRYTLYRYHPRLDPPAAAPDKSGLAPETGRP